MDVVIRTIVDWTVVPLTAPIPFLASSGVLLLIFAALWATFGFALARKRAALDEAWLRLRRQRLVLQGIALLLLMPVVVGLWIWRTSWPLGWRLVLIASLASWNLLVFVPTAA